jgi:hypothetical protein
MKLLINTVSSLVNSTFYQMSKLGSLFSGAQLWKRLQPQRWLSIAFVGLFLLGNSIDSSSLKQSTKDTLNDLTSRGDNGRPATTRQWQSESKRLEGQPGKKAERITQEAGEAVKEFGEIYPENAKTLMPDLENRRLEKGN